MPTTISMTTEEKVLITASPMTAAGNPAPVDGQASFVVQSGACTVAQVDALSAYVVSGSTTGESQILVSCDADLGAGIVLIEDTVTAQVISPTAAALGLEAAAPELK